MLDVLNYKDYRQFLMDWISSKQEKQSWYSIRYFADKIGIDHGNFVRILQGKRELPERTIPACIDQMKLSGRKAEYFRLLVLYQRARNPEKAARLLERLLTLVGRKQMQLEVDQYEFYKCWYHTAIFHLIASGALAKGEDSQQIAKKLTPVIAADQAARSLELLLRLKLIEYDEAGNLVQSCSTITTGEEWSSTIIHNFQKTTLEMAFNSLQKHPREIRDFSTLTLGISLGDIPKIKEILTKARKEIIEVARESEPVDSVYQLNLQLFPMALLEKKKL